MIMDGRLALTEEERPAKPGYPSADSTPETPKPTPELTGQMFKIRKGVEALLEKGEPLSMLKPTQAWRRITSHLKGSGIHALEMPHRSTYNRFRKRYGARYGLR
jgi:hypothetical protein